MGARALKPGCTRFYVGYKKHTLRLWIGGFEPFVLLVPLVSWAAPASVPESYLLKPSLDYCLKRLEFHPDIVVGDMGYIHQETKRHFRARFNVAVVTKMKADMQAHCVYSPSRPLRCQQGQPLAWTGYEPGDQKHYYQPLAPASLCQWCWCQRQCPREFSVAAREHETFFGSIPLNTVTAQKLLHRVRSWIEPAQAFEKNQLGLKRMFHNSLSLCWALCLLADSAVLLRSLAILTQPQNRDLVQPLLPRQFSFEFDE